MIDISDRLYSAVSGNTTISSTYTPANGVKFFIDEMGGDAALSQDCHVEIDWDGQILFSTHASSLQKDYQEFIGDGAKTLSINLVNNTNTTKTIGAYYKGRQFS